MEDPANYTHFKKTRYLPQNHGRLIIVAGPETPNSFQGLFENFSPIFQDFLSTTPSFVNSFLPFAERQGNQKGPLELPLTSHPLYKITQPRKTPPASKATPYRSRLQTRKMVPSDVKVLHVIGPPHSDIGLAAVFSPPTPSSDQNG